MKYVVWRNIRDNSMFPYRIDEIEESTDELSDGTYGNVNMEVVSVCNSLEEAIVIETECNEWASIRYGMLRP